ncbi:MAG: hypothetical protein FWF15_01200 [Oscillospiraceae bacterium]|nr:hypothetical protein [Oscillospiraceae bacterium]
MKRFLIIILLLGVLLSACSQTGNDPESVTKLEETSLLPEEENIDSLAARQLVSDGLPAKDFGGDRFLIATQTRMIDDVYVENLTGDVIIDTVYARNMAIEDRFNVKFSSIDGIYTQLNSMLEKAVLANDDFCDLFFGQAYYTCGIAMKDLLLNWYLVPHINFAQPWWARSSVDDLTYNNKAFIVIGDFSLSAMYATYCMYYDKVVAEDYGITDMYGTVSEGKWTIDKLSELTKDVYRDLNGDGVKDIGDYYGFATDPWSNISAYLYAFDNPVMSKDSAGVPRLAVKTDKINSIVDKLRDLCYENAGSYFDMSYKGAHGYAEGLSQDMFQKGSVLFANGYLQMSVSHFRNVENEYGIIPYPKWNEAQPNYHSNADGFHGILALPKNAVDLDKIGVITEALCAESWKSVLPKYYDVALKVKGARDEESIAMIDLIMDGRVFDFGYFYDNDRGMAGVLVQMIQNRNTGFETYYAANEGKVMAHYNSVLEIFEKGDS